MRRCREAFRQMHQQISPVLCCREISLVRAAEVPPQLEQFHLGCRKVIFAFVPGQAEHGIEKKRTLQNHVSVARLVNEWPQTREMGDDDAQLLGIERLRP